MNIDVQIAKELNARPEQVAAGIQLLDEGATVPFIARYRKEATGGLDDAQLRKLEERLGYLRDLQDRKASILKSIQEQQKLTPDLERAIQNADTKTVLEDLYAPFKPKRRTKAQQAREAGLQPLADRLLKDTRCRPETEAQRYLNPEQGVHGIDDALEGARQILIEGFSENATLVGQLRTSVRGNGILNAKVVKGKEQGEGAKFKDYFQYAERIQRIPSHRALALFRGRESGVLRIKLAPGADVEAAENTCRTMIARTCHVNTHRGEAAAWLRETVQVAWQKKLSNKIEADLLQQLWETAEEEAIRVFAQNLKDLLMAAPAGPRAIIGLDPGLRTGVKVAVVDATGKLLETATIFPHPPRNEWAEALVLLAELAKKHRVDLISIGNGTASRETDRLGADLLKAHPELGLQKLVVSEAGASVYSASELAANELPGVDVSLRGAASIARRLQDPLAELVKIEPKAIGVGQYQHDLNQTRLAQALDNVVEDCVNAVGVNLNTASEALLTQVSGLNKTLAKNIVAYRDEQGLFKNRTQLKKVPRLGEKAFEQAAGFLRIMNGNNPLDASAVHPEAYPVVKRIAAKRGNDLKTLIGDSTFLRSLNPSEFTDAQFGPPTVTDIIAELEKPGRDPRPEFKTASFREGVEKIEDLKPDMELEGVVTNVTNFGAFVDVGVHQDGLVHISQLANQYVKDPHEVVQAGQIVRVRVLKVEVERKRIALSMKR